MLRPPNIIELNTTVKGYTQSVHNSNSASVSGVGGKSDEMKDSKPSPLYWGGGGHGWDAATDSTLAVDWLSMSFW